MKDDIVADDGEKPPNGLYVDLVLGSWRPREAAFQLAVALGVALGTRARRSTEIDLATGVEAVDIAAQGDPLVNQAWDDALRIAAATSGGATIVVLTPRFGLPFRADNEWFFFFLHRLGRAIVIDGEEPPMQAVAKSPFERRRGTVLPNWEVRPGRVGAERLRILRLFPGLVPRPIAEAMNLTGEDVALTPVGRDRFLVPTDYRDKDPRSCAYDFDALESLEADDDGFKAFAQTFCTGHFADVAALTDLGLDFFHAGSRDLAGDLVRRARSVAGDPASIARTEATLAEMLLSERRFAEVVAVPRLSPRAPATDGARLRQLKDWARLGIGDLSGAPEYVATSLRRLGAGEEIDTGDLLRLDQVVRARFAAGDTEGAITLGRTIAAALGRRGQRIDPRLIYANAISLAGIYAARGENAELSREIDRAFETSLGARSPSDILLMNFLRAAAEDDPTSAAASACWLRAGLLWLCHEPREGLGRDAVETILGADKIARSSIDGEMSAALADALARSWPDIAASEAGRIPTIHSAAALTASSPRHLYGGPGAAIVWTSEAMTQPPPPAPSTPWDSAAIR